MEVWKKTIYFYGQMGHQFSMAMLVIARLGIQLKGSTNLRGRTPLPASDQPLGDFLPAGPQQGQLAVNAAKELPCLFN